MSDVTETQLDEELRAKHDTKEREEMAKSGAALPDGSYPIADEDDLKKAIHAVGRGTQNSHNAIRKHIMARAKALGLTSLIPNNWNADGSISEAKSAEWDAEHRSGPSHKDRARALSEAIRNQPDAGSLSAYLTDFDDDTATYESGGKTFQAPYTAADDGSVKLGKPQEVQPVTTYQAVGKSAKRSDGGALERRRAKAESLRSTKAFEHRSFAVADLELRDAEDDGMLHFSGYASITEHPYSVSGFTERIAKNAFKRTLNDNPEVVFLINHDGMPLARTAKPNAEIPPTLFLREDSKGLKVDAVFDPEDLDAKTLALKMKRGLIDEMSFAFRSIDEEWNEDWTERTIKSLTIHGGDVSAVTFGANSATIASMRSDDAIFSLRERGTDALLDALTEWRDLTLVPLEERAGRVLSSSNMETLAKVLDLIGDADEAVDEAQPMLARLMGIPNPDKDGGTDSKNSESDGEPTPPIASSVTDGRSALLSDSPLPDATVRARQALAAMRRRAA